MYVYIISTIFCFTLPAEAEADLPPFGPIEGLNLFFQISSQCESQRNRSAFISFGKLQFWLPWIWDHLFMSYRLWFRTCTSSGNSWWAGRVVATASETSPLPRRWRRGRPASTGMLLHNIKQHNVNVTWRNVTKRSCTQRKSSKT